MIHAVKNHDIAHFYVGAKNCQRSLATVCLNAVLYNKLQP